jgi:hypothetical protein
VLVMPRRVMKKEVIVPLAGGQGRREVLGQLEWAVEVPVLGQVIQ